MEAYLFNDLRQASLSQLEKGLFLALLRVDKLPPHLILIYNYKLYKLDIKGLQINQPAEPLLKAMQRYCWPSIFVKIKCPALFSAESLKSAFYTYQQLNECNSCIFPINDFFKDQFNFNPSPEPLIFELLAFLNTQKLIEIEYGFNINKKSSFSLSKYTFSFVQVHIAALKTPQLIVS